MQIIFSGCCHSPRQNWFVIGQCSQWWGGRAIFFFSINGHARLFKVSLNVFIGGWGGGGGCAILFYSVYDKFNIFVCHKQSKKLSKMKVNFHRNRKNTNYYWYVARGNSSTDYVIIDYITLSDRSRRDDHSYTNVHIYWVSLIGSRYIINNIQKGWYRWYLKY